MSGLFDPIYALLDQDKFAECVDYIVKKQPTLLKYSMGHALLAYAYVSEGSKSKGLEIAK
jgi:hypothetical protein